MYDMLPIEIAATGMDTQRIRMGAVASNLANANSTRNAEGTGPYQRRMVRVRAQLMPEFETMLNELNREVQPEVGTEPERSKWLAELHMRGVDVTEIEKDANVRMVYEPSHPDANEEGYVAYPDISVVGEMTDMIMASRLYEANLATVKNTRDMINQLLELLQQ